MKPKAKLRKCSKCGKENGKVTKDTLPCPRCRLQVKGGYKRAEALTEEQEAEKNVYSWIHSQELRRLQRGL